MVDKIRHKKKALLYGAIIDIHSGSVGIAIVVSRTDDAVPKLIYTHRERIKITENADTQTLVRAMRHALFASTLHFSQNGLRALQEYDHGARISRILLVCGAPWSHTITRFIHLKDEKPFLVTHEKVDALLSEAEKKDKEEFSQSTLLKELNVQIVERVVISTTLNGYIADNPYNKEATELTLAHLSGLVPQAILNAVTEIEDKILMHTLRSTHTYALILYCVLRDLYPHTKNSLIVDISGEATEICVVQDQILFETYTVPFGTHTLIRDVAKKLHTLPEEALTHINEYRSGNVSEGVRAIIESVIDAYKQHVSEAYKVLAEKYVLPKYIFLSVEQDLESLFCDIYRSILIGPHEQNNKPTVIALNSEKASELALSNDEKMVKDVFFSVGARFFHKLHGCGEITHNE